MEWVRTAKVGDQVVLAVDMSKHSARARTEGVTLPSAGIVYTIRDFETGLDDETEIFLRFNELVNGPSVNNGIEPSFFAGYFRPVQRRDTDISVFTSMLSTAPQRVKEDA